MQNGGPAIGTTSPRVPHATISSYEGVVPKSVNWRTLGGGSEAAARTRGLTTSTNKKQIREENDEGQNHRLRARVCAARQRGVGAGHGQARDRPARQLGHLGVRGRPARRHLQEARARARHRLHAGRRRDAAGGDLGQRRYRHRGRRDGRAQRLLEGRAGARDQRRDDRRGRSLLVREGRFADQDAEGHRRQDARLFDQRLLDARRRDGVHEAV